MSGNSTQPTYSPSLLNTYAIGFEGICVSCILYGVYIVIAGANLHMLKEKRYKILWAYSIVQLLITTLYFALALYAAPSQSLAIFHIGNSFGFDAMSPWPIIIVTVTFALNTWASDGFLLYRCYVVTLANIYILAVPTLLYLVTLCGSIASLVVSSTPGAVYSTRAVQVAGLCFWTSSVTMNVCTSCLISIRLWMYRRAMMRAIEFKQGTFYLGYMAMTLESAALYTICAIVTLVMFVLNSQLENVFFPVLGVVQAIAPSLIIYRIARGISLETDHRGMSDIIASLRFSSGQSRTRDFSNGAGTMHAPSDEGGKVDQKGADSFVHEIKDDATSQV